MGFVSAKEAEERQDKLRRLNYSLKFSSDPVLRKLRGGKRYVPGRGTTHPQFAIVGEAPGKTEDQLREPFVGASGRLLTEWLKSVDIKRFDVYVTNTVKWWPTDGDGNTRQPSAAEKEACRPYLLRELSIVGVRHVVALGKHAAAAFLPTDAERAVWHRAPGLPFWVLPLYHPAVGCYRGSMRPQLLVEFSRVLEVPDEAKTR